MEVKKGLEEEEDDVQDDEEVEEVNLEEDEDLQEAVNLSNKEHGGQQFSTRENGLINLLQAMLC